MPRVHRGESALKFSWDYDDYIRTPVKSNEPWSQLTKKEKIIAGAIRLALAGSLAIGALVYNHLPDIVGETHDNRSEDEMEEIALDKFINIYNSRSEVEKVAILYAGSPISAELNQKSIQVDGQIGGSGFLGYFSHSRRNDMYYQLGQDCLEGSAYDTNPSSIRTYGEGGEISAIPNVNSKNNNLIVYPASGLGEPLTFELQENGGYLPGNEVTISTLEAYGCDAGYTPFEDSPAKN